MGICAACLFGSCAEDAFVSYDNFEPTLVVQSRLSPDTTFEISIASSLSPVDVAEYMIPDDLVVSLINLSTGSVINVYRENDKYVAPQAYPEAGESYWMRVTAEGFKSVEMQTSIPEAVELAYGRVENLRLVESEVTLDKLNVSYDLNLVFKPNNHQFFYFSFIQTTTINVGSTSDPDMQEIAYYIDPQFPGEDGFYQFPENSLYQLQEPGVFVDALKTGTQNVIIFSFVDYTLGDLEELGNLYIEVRTVTPEYYYYYTSLARQLISRDDPFAEPIPVYSNIQGGSGNFSGYNRTLYQIPIIP